MKASFIFESTTTTDYREVLFSKTDNVFETLFSNTDNRIDNLTALIAKRLIAGDVSDRTDQCDCVILTTSAFVEMLPFGAGPLAGLQKLVSYKK